MRRAQLDCCFKDGRGHIKRSLGSLKEQGVAGLTTNQEARTSDLRHKELGLEVDSSQGPEIRVQLAAYWFQPCEILCSRERSWTHSQNYDMIHGCCFKMLSCESNRKQTQTICSSYLYYLPNLQMPKAKHREVKSLVRSLTAIKYQKWDLVVYPQSPCSNPATQCLSHL